MIEAKALSGEIIGCAIDVHRALGPGLLESAYEECLAYEFTSRGLTFERQVPLPIVYREVQLDATYRLDFVVQRTVIVEIKSVASVEAIHEAQLLTYLRLAGVPVGLIINFNVPFLRDGVVRRVLAASPPPSASSASSAPPR